MPCPAASSRLSCSLLVLALVVALQWQGAAALQPPPARRERGPHTNAQSRDTVARYLGSAAVGVLPCDGLAGQQFVRDPASGAVRGANGTCLLRDPDDVDGALAGPCDGSPATTWTLTPCTASGCTAGSNQSWLVSGVDGHVLGIPGAVGRTCDVWTVDDPTGAYHNELWTFNATDATIRSLNTHGPPDIFQQCLTLPPPPPPPVPCVLTPRAACHPGVWTSPPTRVPSNGVVDGPLLGNGDLGAVLALEGGPTPGPVLYLGKADLWATNTVVDQPEPSLHSDTFYTAIGGGSLALLFGDASTGAGSVASFSATQDLAAAAVSTDVSILAGSGVVWNVSLTSAIVAQDENTVLMRLRVNSSSGAAVPLTLALTVSSPYALPLSAGSDASAGALPLPWVVKQGVRSADNSMLLMPCDTSAYVYFPSISTFSVDAVTGRVSLRNDTAPAGAPPQCPAQAGPEKLALRACGSDGADWALVPAPATQGAPPGSLQLASLANSSRCAWAQGPAYHNSAGLVSIGACDAQEEGWWSWEEGSGQVQYNKTQCLTGVPPNVNITLAFVPLLLTSADGTPVPFNVSAPATSASAASVRATSLLLPGVAYTLVLAAVTSRDLEGGGGGDPLLAALAAARAYIGRPSAEAARRAAHASAWAAFWNASSVYLGEGRQLLEGFWYGAQYNLACTSRQGAVAPGLWGVWAVSDTNGWNGDATLDYNAQASFYGSCSSNHCEQVVPYLDQVGSEWALAVASRMARASWGVKGSAGGPGQTAMSMGCGYMHAAYEDASICPAPTLGHYDGLAMTTHMGPFPGLFYFADLSLRVVAPMATKPFIDYVDHTGDVGYLNSTAFPILAAVADFFVSYTTWNSSTGVYDFLNSCAQEICGGGPSSESNPHHNVAYVSTTLTTLLRYVAVLGLPLDARVQGWSNLLSHLPEYPTGVPAGSNVTVWTEADDTAAFWGSNGHAYSIVYTAALHPAEAVGLSDDPALLDTAWSTVLALAGLNGWHPLNGLAMAWCPATRVAGQARAAGVLTGWERALGVTMYNNFYPDLGGGGVEQFGATEAVNAALVQSGEGFIRLFPMWPPGDNASFTTLRVKGAFLVSAAWVAPSPGGGNGTVRAPVTILAEGAPAAYARNCTFLDPWAEGGGGRAPVVTFEPGGGAVPLAPAGHGVYTFTAQPGQGYALWPAGGWG